MNTEPPTLVQRARKWARRHRPVVTTLAASTVALLAVVAVAAIVAALRIDTAHKETKAQAEEARAQAEESRRRAVALTLVQGRRALDDGDLPGALLWFVEALRLDQGDPAREEPHRIRIGAILRQYPRLVHAWFHAEPVSHAEFSPDGRYLATSVIWTAGHEGKKGASRVWDTATGELVWTLEHYGQVRSATFTRDGRRLATAGKDKVAQVWDMATGRRILRLERKEPVSNAVFSPDGRYLATGTPAEISLRDAATGEEVRSFKPGGKVRFSLDGRRLITASNAQTQVQVWDVATGELLRTLKHLDWVYHAEFSPDSRYVVTASDDGTARVWDVATGGPIIPPLRHAGAVSFASFSPDGRCLITRGQDKTARLWDAATGQPLAPPLKLNLAVLGVVFSPDGRQVLTASRDETVKRWDLDLSPDSRPIEDLMLLAQLFNGHRLDAAGGIVPLEPAELESAWRALRAKYPGDFAVSPAEVLAWHQCEVGECERLRLWAEAVKHLDLLIEAEPARWFERAARGRAHAELGQWEKATTDLAQAVELGANDGAVWYQYALVHLAAGDVEASRRACRRLLERFGPSKNPCSEHWVARACVLAPAARVDLVAPGPLAEKLEQLNPTSHDDLRLLGALLYRAGRFDEAIKRLDQALKAHVEGGTAWDWLFLAMAHQRLGNPEKAEEWLNKAVKPIEQAQPGRSGADGAALSWDQRLELDLLRAQGSIVKVAPSHRYRLSAPGRPVVTALRTAPAGDVTRRATCA